MSRASTSSRIRLGWPVGAGLAFAMLWALGCGGGDDVVDPGPTATPKVVFVSSLTYNGNLGGLAGADAECQRLAQSAGLTGTYRSFLSDGTTAAISRISRSGPYSRRDGLRVADDWNGLSAGVLQNPISLNELGAAVSPSPNLTWTGTTFTGTPSPRTCSGWTTSGIATGPSDTARLGDVGQFDSTTDWEGSGENLNCNLAIGRLYCIQQ